MTPGVNGRSPDKRYLSEGLIATFLYGCQRLRAPAPGRAPAALRRTIFNIPILKIIIFFALSSDGPAAEVDGPGGGFAVFAEDCRPFAQIGGMQESLRFRCPDNGPATAYDAMRQRQHSHLLSALVNAFQPHEPSSPIALLTRARTGLIYLTARDTFNSRPFLFQDRISSRTSTLRSFGKETQMPIYEYHCKKCEKDFECLVFGSDTPKCPGCETDDVERLMSACGFVSRGTDGMTESRSAADSSCTGCSASSCAGCGH